MSEKTPEENSQAGSSVREEANTASQSPQAEKFWSIKAGAVPTDDPLLGCLVVLTRLEHRPFSPEALSAGLPLVDNRLTPQLFIRAAARANMSAKIVKRDLDKISPLVLPAVLLLKNRDACLLVGIKKKGTIAQIVQPETGDGVLEIKMEQLAQYYMGYTIFSRTGYAFESRTEVSSFEKPKHWFWGVVKKIWPFYIEVIVASLLINIFALVSPLFTMNVYDRVVPNNAIETLIVLAIGIGIVYCFDLLMKMLRSYFIDIAGKKADILLSAVIFEQMIGVRMESRPESVGSFANNMSQFDSFRDFITSATISTIIDLPFVFIFLAVIFTIGGNLMWVPIIAMPFVIISGLVLQYPMNKLVKESYRYSAQKQSMLIETLLGVETIKAMSAESPMQRKWEHLTGLTAKHSVVSKVLSTLATNLASFTTQIAGVAIVILGVLNISEGTMTMGALIACNMLNGRALAPLGQVASLISRYHQSMTALNSIDDLMKMPVERPVGKTPLHRPNLQGAIEFKDVSFQYPSQETVALQNISFRVKPGEKIGVIGRIGSGKSTIEKLLLGLYLPTEGNILLDGTEIQQIDPATLRKNVGYVPQDITLFFGSVKDNIVMAAPYADDSAVLRAASISGTTEFVSAHPKGFDLAVGERGEKLSGGQRQSIAIARALLLDPPILILDEPTNMMDSRSEEMFKLKLGQIIKNKTVFLITHKGGLLSLVDRVMVVDKGQLVADGPKDEILKALSEGKIRMG